MKLPRDSPYPTPAGEALLHAQGDMSLNISQTTAYFTYGIKDWLDASFAVPFVTSTLSAESARRTPIRIHTDDPAKTASPHPRHSNRFRRPAAVE